MEGGWYTVIDCRLDSTASSSSSSRDLRQAVQSWLRLAIDAVNQTSGRTIEFGLLLVRNRWVEEVLPWGRHQGATIIDKLTKLRGSWMHDGSVEKEPARAPPGAGGGDGLLRALRKATIGFMGSPKSAIVKALHVGQDLGNSSCNSTELEHRLEVCTFHVRDTLRYLAGQELSQSLKRIVKGGSCIVVVDFNEQSVKMAGGMLPEGVTVTSVNAGDQSSTAETSQAELVELVSKATIKFATSSATLDPGSITQVRQIARLLKERPAVSIDLLGYTSTPGGHWSTEDKCVQLSQLRCKTVQDLLKKEGVQNAMASTGVGVDVVKGPSVGISISQKPLSLEQPQKNIAGAPHCNGVGRSAGGVGRAVGHWLNRTTVLSKPSTNTKLAGSLQALERFADSEAQRHFIKHRFPQRKI